MVQYLEQSLTTNWFDTLAEEMIHKSECHNSPDMREGFILAKQEPVEEGSRRQILSLDVVDLYPSLDKNIMQKKIFDIIHQSKLRISGLYWVTLALYLVHKVDKSLIKKLGLLPLMPERIPGAIINTWTQPQCCYLHGLLLAQR